MDANICRCTGYQMIIESILHAAKSMRGHRRICSMRVVDIDSHSMPRAQDYGLEPRYTHLKPRTHVDAKGNIRRVFNNRMVLGLSRAEQETGAKGGRTNWGAANYDSSIRYRQVTEAGINFQFISTGIVGEFNYIDLKVGAAFCRAYNDFIYRTFMKPYPKTFTGLPQLPLQDTREAILELERCVKELEMLTFLMPTNWNSIDMAPWLHGDRRQTVHVHVPPGMMHHQHFNPYDEEHWELRFGFGIRYWFENQWKGYKAVDKDLKASPLHPK